MAALKTRESGVIFFFVHDRPDRLLGPTHSFLRWEPWALKTSAKQSLREAEHAAPSSAGMETAAFVVPFSPSFVRLT